MKNNKLQWDLYFLNICNEVGRNSKCLSRKIGAVLVRDHSIISTGYNGPARGTKHCNERDFYFYDKLEKVNNQKDVFKTDFPTICPRRDYGYKSGEGLHLCQAWHAERNALIQAARNGVSTLNTTMYLNAGHCCKDCCIEMINAGVKELVYLDNCSDYDNYASIILSEGGITTRRIDLNVV